MAAGTRPRAGNLPGEVMSFVGRRQEVAEARQLLRRHRLLTLTGVAGVGKTRLALQVAAASSRTFPAGVWLVELGSLQDGELVAGTVAGALGLSDQCPQHPTDALAEYFKDKRALLVLDNCEHLLDACAGLVEALVRAAPKLRVLATSRQPLGVYGESILMVPSLPVPDPDQPASVVRRYEAVSLFAERAAAVLPGFQVTSDNSAALARLCQRLDGIPLAIELAAGQLRMLSLEQILDRLDDHAELLTWESQTGPPRQRTLRAAIGWSFDLCSPAERAVWARCSVFSGGFDLEAAEEVCSGDGIAREDVLDVVANLVDKSILVREEDAGRVRYRLPETIRRYGRCRLADSGEERVGG